MDVDVGRYVETHSHITTDVGRYDKAQLECGVISQLECALNAPHLICFTERHWPVECAFNASHSEAFIF